MKKFIKVILIFFTLIILVALNYAIFKIIKDQKNKTAETPQQDTEINPIYESLEYPIDKNVDYRLNVSSTDLVLPENTSNKVYRIDENNKYYPSKTMTDSIAEEQNIQIEINDNDILLYESATSNISLEYYIGKHYFNIYFIDETTRNNTDSFNLSSSKIIAQKKLDELSLWPWDETNEYEILYQFYKVSGNNYNLTQSIEEASLLEVTFTSIIDDIQVIGSRTSSGEIKVKFDTPNHIKSIYYAYRPIVEGEVGMYPIKSIYTALEEIPFGKCELIQDFESAGITTVYLELATVNYRITFDEQNYLQPIYAFEGTDNNDQLVTILTPAIEDSYLITPD